MKALFNWFFSLFKTEPSELASPTEKEVQKETEEFLLKMKIAELEKSIIQLGEIIQKTNQTIVVMQENIKKTTKVSNTSLNLSQQHEDIFKKIIEDKLLVFGLTKKTKVVDPDEPEPKPD